MKLDTCRDVAAQVFTQLGKVHDADERIGEFTEITSTSNPYMQGVLGYVYISFRGRIFRRAETS